MAKDRKKTIHIHSSIEDRQPIASLLEVGELGVNNCAGKEFISTKNTAGSVVRFSSDEQIVSIMEHKEVIPYSGVVDNIDLENNRSNIEIKLNQVASSGTVKHDSVNGAKDIDGDLVNPTSDGGLTDGAGFAIDMSAYVLSGGNPTFSSVTTTCGAVLQGTTEIKSATGDCESGLIIGVPTVATTAGTTTYNGNTADAKIEDITVSGATLSVEEDTTEIMSCTKISAATNNFEVKQCDPSANGKFVVNEKESTISGDTLVINEATNVSAKTPTTYVSGQTTEVKNESVSVSSCTKFEVVTDSFEVKQCTNNGGETSFEFCNGFDVKSNNVSIEECDANSGNISLTANNVCINGGARASMSATNVKIGDDCSGNTEAETVAINSNTSTTINSPETIITGETKISGQTTIGGTLDAKSGLSKTLSWEYGDVSAAASGETNFKENKTITIPKSASDISRATLKLVYGNASDKNGEITYDPGDSTGKTVSIPTCVSHLNRATLGYSYGDVHDKVGDSGSYDPGDNCENTASDSIVIPTCIENLTNWSEGCFSIANDVCITGDVTATGGFYSTSDERKKENIHHVDEESKKKVRNIPLKEFNFRDDNTKRKVYGVIAQEVEAAGLNELVHTDEQGMKAVDYTSFLILRMAYLEKTIGLLHNKIVELEGKINK